jgi:hypothetical protein
MENIQIFDGLFSNEELDWLIQNDIVLNQRENLSDTNPKRRFSLNLPENMKAKLQSLGLSENAVSIPMMWINNDMSTHIDSGEGEFNETMLVYISDCQGSLVINDNSYEIKQNRAFKFQKGLEHSTENTGNEPRLLIGPMSESGFAVGASLYYFVDSAALNSVVPDNDNPNYEQLQLQFAYQDFGDGFGIYTILLADDYYNLQNFQQPPGTTLIGWEGKYGFANNYTQVSYNPGLQLDGLPGNLYLYPVWSQPQQQNIMCFKEGTNILCFDQETNTEKYIPIEDLRNGALVKTRSSGYQPICMIGSSTIYNPSDKLRGKNRLYRCSKDKYPDLTEDLIITGCHSILVYTITDKEREDLEDLMGKIYVTENRYRLMACVDERAEPYEEEGLYTIWHFALEHEHIRANYGVYANGLLVESSSKRMMSEYSGMKLLM